MTAVTRRRTATVAAEAGSLAAVLVVIVPPLAESGITAFGVWFLAGLAAATHLLGYFPTTQAATVVGLLAGASVWAAVHIETGGSVRAAVVVGLLLWASEELRDLSVTFRRAGHTPGLVTLARLPRYLGIAASALAADVLLVAFLREPPVSGWVWRLVGAGAIAVLLLATRPARTTGS